MDEYYQTIRLLPGWLARPLAELPTETAEQVHELRLRVGCTVQLVVKGVPALPETLRGLQTLRLTQLQLDEVLLTLCGGSVHTHQSEIAEGFVSLPGGGRAGLGGRFLLHPVQGVVLQQLHSVSLRVARQKATALPPQVEELLKQRVCGIVLVGEPDSGKTTLLRGVARALAAQKKIVCVIDERREIFPEQGRRFEMQQTDTLDCISGLPKGRAVQMALRALSPQVILLDELGGMEEVRALEQGLFSGVEFVATLHASSWDEAFRRPQLCALRQSGALQAAVLLRGRQFPGQVQEVRLL